MRFARPMVMLLAVSVAGGGVLHAQEERRMSLKQALETALANNLDLVLARLNPQDFEQDAEVARADFDPEFSAVYNRAERDDVTTSAEQVSRSDSDFIRSRFELRYQSRSEICLLIPIDPNLRPYRRRRELTKRPAAVFVQNA